MTAGTPSQEGKNHFDKLANGLAINHAFTVLSAHELKDAKGKTIKLVKIRIRQFILYWYSIDSDVV